MNTLLLLSNIDRNIMFSLTAVLCVKSTAGTAELFLPPSRSVGSRAWC